MKTEVKKIDGIKRELSVELGPEAVKNKFDEVFKRLAKEAKVPGFRVGHAPRDILEKHFFSQAREQVINELLPQAYQQALEKEMLDAVDLPEISDVKLDNDAFFFKAKLEVVPEIKLKNYKGIEIDYKKPEVSAEDIKRSIDGIKESRKADALDDNFARALGYPDFKSLEASVEKQLYLQKENQERQRIEEDILEAVTKDLDFQIPNSLIERDLNEMLRQASLELALKGIPKEKIEEQQKQMREKFMPQAKKRVKAYLVLSAIAKKENIPQGEDLVNKTLGFLLSQASWQPAS